MKKSEPTHVPRGAVMSQEGDEQQDPGSVAEDQKSEAELAAHQAKLGEAADAEKAKIEEHAFADRSEIDNQAAADRAAVDAKLEAAKPEAEKVSPEAALVRRLHMIRHVRDQALTASRQLDVHRLGQAVHDLADLIHEMMSEHK